MAAGKLDFVLEKIGFVEKENERRMPEVAVVDNLLEHQQRLVETVFGDVLVKRPIVAGKCADEEERFHVVETLRGRKKEGGGIGKMVGLFNVY